MTILSVGNDAKTVKGEKLGYLTGIQYLAPAMNSGFVDLCKYKSAGCEIACLFTAGRGVFASVQSARVERTRRFVYDKAAYMAALVTETEALVRKAARQSLIPAVRLNGTSDIPWERVPVTVDGVRYVNIMALFPTVQFYDYTKYPMHTRPTLPANYHLTMSRSETNERDALQALAAGRNAAVVFAVKRGQPLPATWHGWPVIDGDLSDVRFDDPVGVVVGLRGKGQARNDTSDFVVAA
jgi:hypothetical protein